MSLGTHEEIRRHIEENMLFRGDGERLSDTDSLLAAGLIDSTGVLELVAFLEERFGLTVADADIVPRNFDSIAGLATYVEARLEARTGRAEARVGHAD